MSASNTSDASSTPTGSSSAAPFALTEAQSKAVQGSLDFLKTCDESAELRISGLAGTGKTTTLVEIVRAIQDAGWRPAVCTPTGKAAHVINSKQNVFTATTLHKALTERPIDRLAHIHKRLDELDLMEQGGGTLSPAEAEERQNLTLMLDEQQKEKENLGFVPIEIEDFMGEFNCLVFDESSMIGKTSTYDLLIDRIPVPRLYFGDSAQLPPVKDTPAIDLAAAEFRFEQILRQAAGSGIIPFSHHITKKNSFPKLSSLSGYDDITIIKNHRLEDVEGYEGTDYQILVWKNQTRRDLSKWVRYSRGFDFTEQDYQFLPMVGEQLMIDQNDDKRRLLKGQIVTVQRVMFYNPGFNPFVVMVEVEDERKVKRTFPISLTDLADGYPVPEIKSDADRIRKQNYANRKGVGVMYPYAITVHKAQGSEWDKVFVLGEMQDTMPDWRRWACTAATRARKHLVYADHSFRFDKSG